MGRCVIVGGANITKYDLIKSFLKEDDFFVFCDSGLNHLYKLGVKPGLVVGDFDSHEKLNLNVETIMLPCEKDDTDTVFAVKEMLKRGADEFLIIGAIGGRFDHSLGNLGILSMLHGKGIRAQIIDDYSIMEQISGGPHYVDDSFSFFSLISIGGAAKGITIKNAKYALNNAEITPEYQYGVSNEVLPGEKAEISISEGKLLVIKVF